MRSSFCVLQWGGALLLLLSSSLLHVHAEVPPIEEQIVGSAAHIPSHHTRLDKNIVQDQE